MAVGRRPGYRAAGQRGQGGVGRRGVCSGGAWGREPGGGGREAAGRRGQGGGRQDSMVEVVGSGRGWTAAASVRSLVFFLKTKGPIYLGSKPS